MKIIIVGSGKIGKSTAEALIKEGHDIVLVDKNANKVEEVSSELDCLGIIGNGASFDTLIDAGIKDADVLIATTEADELNLLCCLFAKKAGNVKTIARVRNPIYKDEIRYISDELGLAMIINPEEASAKVIANLIRFPNAIKIDSFEGDKLEILSFIVNKDSILNNQRIMDIMPSISKDALIVGIERDNQAIIPNGHTVIYENDKLSVCIDPKKANDFFKKVIKLEDKVNNVFIIGGSNTAYYLSKILLASGLNVAIVDEDKKRCLELVELLPKAKIINADATNESALVEEGIKDADAFIALTGMDEENIILSLYAKNYTDAKVITKVNKLTYDDFVGKLDLDSIIVPRMITAESIVRFVRAMDNSSDNEIISLYKILNGKAEALSFKIKEDSEITSKTLLDLRFKDNLLIGAIIRDRKVITPSGKDMIKKGDSVVVVTTHLGLKDISDILA